MHIQELIRKYQNIWSQLDKKTLARKAIIYGAATIAGFYLLFQFLARVGFFGEVPGTNDLKGFDNHNSSRVYAAGGEILGKYFIYDRTAVTLEELSPWVVPALISTEDVRFFRHNGTDYFSLGRVLIKNILLGQRSAGGGSTITRQLAKNLYPRQRRGLIWLIGEKIREGIIAGRLERVYSKHEILTLYLNTVPLGENTFGISAASQRFFNKHPGQLNLQEAATLVGMLKATTAFNPRINPEASLSRRNVVIGQLERYEHITGQQADSLQSLPLDIDYNLLSHGHGPATYFREMLRQELKDILEAYNKRNDTSLNLYTSGLQIYTTIDYHLQMEAEQAYSKQMRALQNTINRHYSNTRRSAVRPLLRQLARRSERYKALRQEGKSDAQALEQFEQPSNILFFDWNGVQNHHKSPMDSIFASQKVLHGGLVSMNPENGHILAWVGGNNIRFFQFDHVVSRRQTGSAFKPFVYAAAIEAGANPCDLTTNERPVFADYDNWSPENHDGVYDGYYSMQGALTHSVNTVSVRYLDIAGVDAVIHLAQAAGIRGKLPALPSLALGTAETSLLDLTAAYAIFLNGGVSLNPFFLIRVEDAEGNIIYRGRNIQSQDPVMHQETSVILTHMLRSVVNSGTAASIRNFVGYEYDLAGKTGTTQNNSDSWFIGFTPNLITGVWVGLENPAFNSVYPLPLGASGTAVPIWADFHAQIAQNWRTRKYMAGFLPAPGTEWEDFLNCPMYAAELQKPGLLERIMGHPGSRALQLGDEGRDIQNRNRIRELIENAFRKRENP